MYWYNSCVAAAIADFFNTPHVTMADPVQQAQQQQSYKAYNDYLYAMQQRADSVEVRVVEPEILLLGWDGDKPNA